MNQMTIFQNVQLTTMMISLKFGFFFTFCSCYHTIRITSNTQNSTFSLGYLLLVSQHRYGLNLIGWNFLPIHTRAFQPNITLIIIRSEHLNILPLTFPDLGIFKFWQHLNGISSQLPQTKIRCFLSTALNFFLNFKILSC